MFGLGGIYTEVIRDRSIGLPPMNRLLAHRLMQETRAYQLLSGYRNRPAADMALIAYKSPGLQTDYHVNSFMEITRLPFFQENN